MFLIMPIYIHYKKKVTGAFFLLLQNIVPYIGLRSTSGKYKRKNSLEQVNVKVQRFDLILKNLKYACIHIWLYNLYRSFNYL